MNKLQMEIRSRVLKTDAAAVDEIVRSTGFFREDEVKVAVELVEERLSRGRESGYEFLFITLNEKPVAYSCYGLIPCSVMSYDLYWIVTHHDFRGQGIGRQLLALTEEKITGAGGKAVYAETSSTEKYTPTRAFYEKNNYLLKARFEDFYDHGDDKMVYVKYLR